MPPGIFTDSRPSQKRRQWTLIQIKDVCQPARTVSHSRAAANRPLLFDEIEEKQNGTHFAVGRTRNAACDCLVQLAPITPRSIEYSYSAEESREGKVCAIVTSLTNAKPPQNVTFTIFAGYSRQDKAIGVGFLIAAAQQSPSRRSSISICHPLR